MDGFIPFSNFRTWPWPYILSWDFRWFRNRVLMVNFFFLFYFLTFIPSSSISLIQLTLLFDINWRIWTCLTSWRSRTGRIRFSLTTKFNFFFFFGFASFFLTFTLLTLVIIKIHCLQIIDYCRIFVYSSTSCIRVIMFTGGDILLIFFFKFFIFLRAFWWTFLFVFQHCVLLFLQIVLFSKFTFHMLMMSLYTFLARFFFILLVKCSITSIILDLRALFYYDSSFWTILITLRKS